jgi:predicted membrane protein
MHIARLGECRYDVLNRRRLWNVSLVQICNSLSQFYACSQKAFDYDLKVRDEDILIQLLVFWTLPNAMGHFEFLATDPEVSGSIPGATRFSQKKWVWKGVHSAS